jgi:outer membrane receptor protein involved in Fe transport
VRYDDYNLFDGETTWQVGFQFQAIESLKFRATANTVFRAPTITDLFGGQVDSFPTFTDPCAVSSPPETCARRATQLDSQVRARVGGSPDVEPETGDTVTAGLVWTPEIGASDLSVTLDYWDISLDDGISSLGVQFILDQCYLAGDQEQCAKITRANNSNYNVTQILDLTLNVAEQGARGVDTELRWSTDSQFGQWEAAFLWSHLLERTKTANPLSEEEDLSGRYSDPTAQDGGAYATDKINYSVQWYRNGFSVGYLGEYISDLDADTFCNCDSDGDPSNNLPDGTYIQKIDSQLYHDLVASYTYEPTNTRVSLGVTNLTDEEPPFIEVGFNANTDPSTYRLFGRGYYLRLTQTFE